MSDDEYVRPDMRQIPDLMDLINLTLDSWEAVRDSCGPEIAGDPVRDLATALVMAGYKRVTE